MTQFWFLLSLFFIILELSSPGLFFFLALSLGAIITMLMQLFEIITVNEFILFFVSSAIMFVLLQCTIKYMQKKNSTSYISSMQDVIGTITEITQLTSPSTGYVNLDGVDWAIKVHHAVTLHVGMKIKIIGIKGCHLEVIPHQ